MGKSTDSHDGIDEIVQCNALDPLFGRRHQYSFTFIFHLTPPKTLARIRWSAIELNYQSYAVFMIAFSCRLTNLAAALKRYYI
jgi:hypothetical protein